MGLLENEKHSLKTQLCAEELFVRFFEDSFSGIPLTIKEMDGQCEREKETDPLGL